MTTLTRITLGRLARPGGAVVPVATAGLIDVEVADQIGVSMDEGSLITKVAASVDVSVNANSVAADVVTSLTVAVETINVEVGICNG